MVHDKIEIKKEKVEALNKKLDDGCTEEIVHEDASEGVISGITSVSLGTTDNELNAWNFLFW